MFPASCVIRVATSWNSSLRRLSAEARAPRLPRLGDRRPAGRRRQPGDDRGSRPAAPLTHSGSSHPRNIRTGGLLRQFRRRSGSRAAASFQKRADQPGILRAVFRNQTLMRRVGRRNPLRGTIRCHVQQRPFNPPPPPPERGTRVCTSVSSATRSRSRSPPTRRSSAAPSV